MAGIRLDVVTAERRVYSEEVDLVVAPGMDGEMAILPGHAALMTTLRPGEVIVRRDGEETPLVITGGFMEVRPERVTVLADAAEHIEEIDTERAEAAKRRAEERLGEKLGAADLARAEAALRRSMIRLRVVQRRRRRMPEV